MGFLFVGKGHQIMMLKLSRPCRYSDLSRSSDTAELSELALVADGASQALVEAIRAWRSVVPHTRLILFHTSEYGDVVRAVMDAVTTETVCGVHSYQELVHNPQALQYKVWASCAPYDPYGVLVKTQLETALSPLLSQNKGIFLAHDPQFGVVRWFDSEGLRDRLQRRSVRLRFYRLLCRVVHGFAWVSCRVKAAEFKWRKV